MKKVYYAAATLAMAALVSCNNKEEKIDTTGSVPAKVINTMDETDIIISEDSMSNSDSVMPSVDEAVPEDLANDINETIQEEQDNEQKTDKKTDKKKEKKSKKETADNDDDTTNE